NGANALALLTLDADFANRLQTLGDSFVGRSLSAHRPQGQYGSVGHQNLLSPVHLTPSSWLETLAATVRERCGIINGNIPMDSMTICSTLPVAGESRSEEHTSELQSRENLVCRLLLE